MNVESGLPIDRGADDPCLEKLREGIERVHVQSGGGLFRLYLFNQAETADLIVASCPGIDHASKLLCVIANTADRIRRSARRRTPVLCMCCPRCVRRLDGVRIGILTAAADNAVDALGFAICQQCSAKADLDEKVIGALRGIWPDLRPIAITHRVRGHA